ncbi:MAG: hypothetical protein BGO01_03405 [Armatimonadetes bacterium 55-13]|nr:MAG: hypothetical protein BGO01_03405 [Armatimonadetes bacterium 55-13]
MRNVHRGRRAFTLIELLTVIAITAVLLTIIVLPIFQSFNLTRAAQAYSDAQDKARVLIEKIQREVNNGVSVRDNSGINGAITVVVPFNGTDVPTTIENMKLDIIKPAEGDPSLKGAGGGFLVPVYDAQGNFVKYIEDPTLRSPKGQVVLPVLPGVTGIRYFVGLARPLETDATSGNLLAARYNNPYDGLLMARTGGRDDLYVLYRAEYQAKVWDPAANGGTGGYIPNTQLFEVDGSGNPVLDDPAFFTLLPGTDYNPDRTLTAAGAAKAARIQNWQRRATIQTEVSRYDMILPVYDKASRLVAFDNRTDPADGVVLDRPRLVPLVQLRPTRVSGEPAEAKRVSKLGEEQDNGSQSGPDTYVTRMGAWSSTLIRTYPAGWLRTDPNFNEYLVTRVDSADGHTKIFEFDPDGGVPDDQGGIPVFDLTVYAAQSSVLAGNPLAAGPFTAAVLPGALTNAATRNLFMAHLADSGIGRVIASFGIDTVKLNGSALPPGVAVNQPQAATGPALTPTQDPGAGAVYSGAGYEINSCFNRNWNDGALVALRGGQLHRFIDLRTTLQIDGSISPLHPTQGFGRAKIVPGTEVVIGPDQHSGPNFGQPVRYTRTTSNPGPNQYRINYVDQPEPTDYSLYGLPNPPAVYDPASFVSAVFQPRFKAGYIQLNSDPNVALPAGNIRVYYRFQFTGGQPVGSLPNSAKQDTYAVDYDTRQLMSILLTIRNYPQSNLPNPQTVTLSATAKVRNYLR